MNVLRRSVVTILALGLLAACAQTRPPSHLALPMLELPPAGLGASLGLIQRLTVLQLPEAAWSQRPGAEQSLDVQLEVEPTELRLAALALNQRVLTLYWDGHALRTQRHPLLPAAVDAARVLRDIQFVYWPLDAVAAALPPGWSVSEAGQRRTLSLGDEPQMQVEYSGQPRWRGRAMLDNRREGYRLTIDSTPMTER